MSSKDITFKSRGLLHSISVFSEADWSWKQIKEHKQKFLTRFCKDYGLNQERLDNQILKEENEQ